MKLNRRLIIFTIILVVLATACKVFFGPNLDWSGFSPVIAIALFSGFIIRQKDLAFLLPLLALFISDLVIQVMYQQNLFPYSGFYSGQWKNYLVLLASTLLGWVLNGKSYVSLALGAVMAPVVYFLVSNYLVWKATSEGVYSKSFAGLMTSYDAGLPFFRNSLAATLLFLPVILLTYNYLVNKKTRLKLDWQVQKSKG
jgi:hypothetical protein